MKQVLRGATPTRQANGRWNFSGPVYRVFYDRRGIRFRREYDFTVVTAKGGYVITAFGNYRRTVGYG